MCSSVSWFRLPHSWQGSGFSLVSCRTRIRPGRFDPVPTHWLAYLMERLVTSPLAGLIASVGLALVITAATLPGRQTSPVVSSIAWGGAHLEEAALGQMPKGG